MLYPPTQNTVSENTYFNNHLESHRDAMSERTPMMSEKKKKNSKLSYAVDIPMSGIYQSREDMENSVDDDDDTERYLPYRNLVYSIKRKNVEAPVKTKDELSLTAEKNKSFMKSVIHRDVIKVKQDLENDPKLTSYTDDFGVSAIEEAVKSRSVELIDLFVTKATQRNKIIVIEHALLYAIKENRLCIVEYLLKERAKLCAPVPKKNHLGNNSTNPSTESVNLQQNGSDKLKSIKKMKALNKTWADRRNTDLPGFEDAEYAPFITPIVLAAKLERLEVIKLLNDYDASEIHPLTMACPYAEGMCEICIERKVFKSRRDLEDSNRLLEIYRALSSPGYIFLSGVEDPILEVFELTNEMENLKMEDPSFKVEYEEIASKCKHFAREMLDLCRTTKEAEILLGKEDQQRQVDRQTHLCRVRTAIIFQQKEFIAHPYCQQVLQKSWYRGLPKMICDSEKFYLMLALYMLGWLLLWPLACIIYMIKVYPGMIRFMKCPINKFITDTLSFITFLVLLFVNDVFYHDEGHHYKGGDLFKPIEWVIITWILGMSARQGILMWRHRTSCKDCCCTLTVLKSSIRWFDGVVLLFFWLWILLRIMGIIYAYATGTEDDYREYWINYHPILLSEAFFAVGTVLSFIKLTGLFKASSVLGPLQISLKNMIKDILRFLLIFAIVITGFVVAITKIYSPYKGSVRFEGRIDEKRQMSGYIGFQKTYSTLFWNIFGYGDIYDNADIVVDTTESRNQTTGNETEIIKHKFTEGVGYFLIGSYHIVAVVVLLNMLIAMMANSYNTIERDADKEWKFARARLQMTYFNDVGSLPPPFNVAIIGGIMKCLVSACTKCSKRCRVKYRDRGYYIKHDQATYTKLMVKLNKRYWNRKKVQQGKEIKITPDELENLLRAHNAQI